ncbi:MAG: FAD-binding oxidoreductase [Actinomycetota bacterium]|nr:FAD-binding oxidoreductase [Actinomycetota bacterium]
MRYRRQSDRDYRSYSFWLDTVPDDLSARPSLETPLHVDVAIVGAGYTGLWTAYYLAKADPALKIAVLEREIAGFGASGRNGGWCSPFFSADKEKLARLHGRDRAIAMHRAVVDSVGEVERVVELEGIDAQLVKGGSLTCVTQPGHLDRIREDVEAQYGWGFSEDDIRWLDADAASERIRVEGCLGAAFTPHCAALHPARLVRGLARAVERLGVEIYEHTAASSIEPGMVNTPNGVVRADVIVRATEGYTPGLPGMKRRIVPLYSLMIATEPLPESFWDAVGWSGRETLTDGRHMLVYAQRTADDRIAIGGRGAPYHFGSQIDDHFDRDPSVFGSLREVVGSLWPQIGPFEVTHTWGGPLGVPRDWHSSVGLDRGTGIAWAGGYVGDGVSTSNLAGRTLADLISARDGDLVMLPWVDHRSRRWEPEPLRWVGANLALRVMTSADRSEVRTGQPARRAQLAKRLLGM